MEDRYAHLRVRNEHGALRKGGRQSVDFKSAHRAWQSEAAQILELSGAARLFDVGIRRR